MYNDVHMYIYIYIYIYTRIIYDMYPSYPEISSKVMLVENHPINQWILVVWQSFFGGILNQSIQIIFPKLGGTKTPLGSKRGVCCWFQHPRISPLTVKNKTTVSIHAGVLNILYIYIPLHTCIYIYINKYTHNHIYI